MQLAACLLPVAALWLVCIHLFDYLQMHIIVRIILAYIKYVCAPYKLVTDPCRQLETQSVKVQQL